MDEKMNEAIQIVMDNITVANMKILGRNLGLSNTCVEDIFFANHGHTEEIKYQILNKWRDGSRRGASVEKLIEVLDKCGFVSAADILRDMGTIPHSHRKGFLSFTVEDICKWLQGLQINETTISIFQENGITGNDLANILTQEDLQNDFNIKPFLVKKIFWNRDQALQQDQQSAQSPSSTGLHESKPTGDAQKVGEEEKFKGKQTVTTTSQPVMLDSKPTPSKKATTQPSLPPHSLKTSPVAVKAKPLGTTCYIGERFRLEGSQWSMQVLGTRDSGTEPGQFNGPSGLAFHGNWLVVCDYRNNRLVILDRNFVVIAMTSFESHGFEKPFRPQAVTVSADGRYFITDDGNKQIIVCKLNEYNTIEVIQIINTLGIDARGIAVMGQYVFATDCQKDGSLVKYNITNGNFVAKVNGQLRMPHSVVVTSNNHLLVSEYDNHCIKEFDSDLKFLNQHCTKGDGSGQLQCPLGMCVDSLGNIYVCDWGNRRVQKLKCNGNFDNIMFQGVVRYPRYITVSADCNTFAVTMWDSTVFVSGHRICVFSR